MSKSALDNACKMGCNMGLAWFRSRDGVTRKPGSVTARCPICRFGSGFRLHEPAGDRQTGLADDVAVRSEEHTSELQSLMRISYAVFCLKKKKYKQSSNVYTTIV